MTIRWGFLGAGYVASRAMAPAVHGARGALLQSVASRDQRRSSFLEPRVIATSYRELIEDPAVDAVYVSLANSQHREWVIAALQAGKHVLCEKPLGIDAADVYAMRVVAEQQQRHLIEASWIRWHPRFRRFTEIVTSGALGDITSIDSSFTFENSDPENYRWKPSWGGGALLDVGCYQAHVWVALAGVDVAVSVNAVSRQMSETGVDATTIASATLSSATLSSEVAAQMRCSFVLPPQQELIVSGVEHRLSMASGEAFTSWREPSSLRIDGVVETFPAVDAFVVMVEEVSACLNGESGWVVPLMETEKVALVLDDIAATPSVGTSSIL